MLSLPESLDAALDAGRRLVVPDGERAAAVRLAHAATQVARGRSLWRTPDVTSWTGWLEREAAAATASMRLSRLLGDTEAWLLWRECALHTARRLDIAASDALVEALRRGAQLAAEWRVPVAAIERGIQVESAWLASTMREFEARCRAMRARPLGRLADEIDRSRTAAVDLAGFSSATPSQRLTIARWMEQGADIRQLAAPTRPGHVSVAGASDPAEEAAAAADWARARLLEDPCRRLLVVWPSLSTSRSTLARVFGRAVPSVAIEGGEPLADAPLVRHALASLRLPLAPLDFDALAAWLRAPYWQGTDEGARARLESWLRTRLAVRVSSQQLLEALGAAPPALAAPATQIARQLGEAQRHLEGAPARSNVWVERFTLALSALGFPGAQAAVGPQPAHVRLLDTFSDLAMLDVALGDLTRESALDWLERLVSRTRLSAAPLDPAVTITDGLRDPVVRYDGIWVGDLRADTWPPAVRRDPFIPAEAQLAAGMPEASPAGQIAQARSLLARWASAADEAVFSWPRTAEDAEQLPSALLAELADTRPYVPAGVAPMPAHALFAARAVERIDDDAGEPWAVTRSLPGGARSVEHQIRCAFRAYAELRLRALPLENPRPGLDPRERGQLAHRTLELLWQQLGDSAGLAAARGGAMLERLIAGSAERAAAELLGDGATEDRRRAMRREQRRVARLAAALCAVEAERPAFTVIGRELHRTLVVEGARLDVRLDRVDRLEDGSLALLDYKTSKPHVQDWLGERPSHPQLLVYAGAVEGQVAAFASAHLSTGRVGLRGMADRDGRLPGVKGLTPAPQADRDAWPRQLGAWRALVAQAVRDFLAGRAVRDPAEGACALCHLHALCRIADEQNGRADDE